MGRTLNARQCAALKKLEEQHGIGDDFIGKGKLVGIGGGTLDSLVELGLVESGPSRRNYGAVGWRLADDGWRCMYGMTLSEALSRPAGSAPLPHIRPLRWPPAGRGE